MIACVRPGCASVIGGVLFFTAAILVIEHCINAFPLTTKHLSWGLIVLSSVFIVSMCVAPCRSRKGAKS